MADTKITALASISTSTDPAVDPLVIVDVSDTSMAASGTSKKVTLNQLLGAGGTATLASATITGDLTVRTDKLLVTSSGVGFGVNPNYPVDVLSTGVIAQFLRDLAVDTGIQIQADNSGAIIRSVGNHALRFNTDVVDRYVIDSTGISTWSVAGTTAMTLNSTGLGIGVASASIAARLHVKGAASQNPLILDTLGYNQIILQLNGANRGQIYADATNCFAVVNSAGSATPLVVTDTGNVGIGVTPIAWASGFKELQVGAGSALGTNGAVDRTDLAANWYYNSGDKYINATGKGSIFSQSAGVFSWLQTNTASGGVGSAMTLTTAMTLDASGNLLVKKTAISASTLGCELTATGQINGATANLDNLNIYNTTAAAYRFYVSGAGTIFATNTVISAISDARLKENVQDLDVGLAEILSLKPRKFDWKAGKGKDIKGDRGFIAQEFETVFPNLIDEWKDPAPKGEAPYKSVRQDLIPVLVKAIQELTARLQTLEAR